MVEVTNLYEQLETLAQENHTDVESLILQIQGIQLPANPSYQSAEYLELLVSATMLASDMRSLEPVLSNWYQLVCKIITYDLGILLLYEDSQIILRHIDDKLATETHNLHADQRWQAAGTPFFRLSPKREPVILEEAERQELLEFLGLSSLQHVMIIPIMNSGGVLGILIFASQGTLYRQQHAHQLVPFVNILSGLLQNDQLISTIYQSTDELATLYHATSVLFEADTLEDFAIQITEVVARTFDYADCGLMVVDEDDKTIIRMKRSGPEVVEPLMDLTVDGQGLVPKAIREERLIYEPDVRSSQDYIIGDERSLCELVVPLKSPQRILGVLDFQSLQTDAFNERDQRLVVALAERVAPALENVLLYEKLRRHMTELEHHVEQRTLELQNTKEQLEIILRSSPDAIVLLDSRGQILQANLSLLTMIGKSMGDVIGKRLADFLPTAHQQAFQDILEKTLQDELENDISVELPYHNSKKHIDVEISLAPIIDDRDSGVVCNIRDMTQHKQTERLLRDALNRSQELNQLKINLVTMASHEFRTPLTTILSSSDIVAQYQDRLSPEKIERHMLKINREVEYLNSLIDDILLLGRSDDERFSAKYRPTDMTRLVREVVDRVRETDHNEHPIAVMLDNNMDAILTDGNLLSHVIDNLLTNACKYSKPGKTVSLNISYDKMLKIIVRDQGIGIPDKDREMLFESFYRGGNVGNVRGTGIGLAIVHEILNAMNGRIEVQSKLNEGTSIEITIPVPPAI